MNSPALVWNDLALSLQNPTARPFPVTARLCKAKPLATTDGPAAMDCFNEGRATFKVDLKNMMWIEMLMVRFDVPRLVQ